MTTTNDIIDFIQLSPIGDSAFTLSNDFLDLAIERNVICPLWIAHFFLQRATDGKTIDKVTAQQVMKDIIKIARDNKNSAHDELCRLFLKFQQN